MITLYNGDCLIESDKIESGSVDLILTDLPYGVVKMKEKSGKLRPYFKILMDFIGLNLKQIN